MENNISRGWTIVSKDFTTEHDADTFIRRIVGNVIVRTIWKQIL